MTTGTAFSEIFDSFLSLVNDYKLITLYDESVTNFETYLTSWLAFAVVDFNNCSQSLVYSTTTNLFTEALTTENQLILARIMVKYWLTKEVQDITQMSLHITDRDFAHFSEAQNLREKSAYLITVKEDVSQALVDYGLKTVDWADWLTGVFYTP